MGKTVRIRSKATSDFFHSEGFTVLQAIWLFPTRPNRIGRAPSGLCKLRRVVVLAGIKHGKPRSRVPPRTEGTLSTRFNGAKFNGSRWGSDVERLNY
jgi:hypothetical protein